MSQQYYKELIQLLDQSYAPYSGFNVASIIVCNDGGVYKGVNVESAAYPTTICAERNAIHTAVTNGVKKGGVQEVHILARNDTGSLIRAFPCGSCRQVIAEQSSNDAIVYCYNENGDVVMHTIVELLPFAFLGDEL
ncbi:cytidine deaminase [Psychromonas sp. RZ22]|uniref:cytidine deaminase n=1 Tax=Psychromonas algarum TaxID=2555643 RepID=UPI0010676BC5|nr:cytidine deaminase [Psychromonas sp. RZ22]TEW53710.1 cytidine deaminase [Psychromonas sp. RZ22]